MDVVAPTGAGGTSERTAEGGKDKSAITDGTVSTEPLVELRDGGGLFFLPFDPKSQ